MQKILQIVFLIYLNDFFIATDRLCESPCRQFQAVDCSETRSILRKGQAYSIMERIPGKLFFAVKHLIEGLSGKIGFITNAFNVNLRVRFHTKQLQ